MRRRRSGPPVPARSSSPALVCLALISLASTSPALTGCAPQAPGPPPARPVSSSTAALAPAAHVAAHPLAGHAGGEVRLSGEGYPAHGRVVFTFHGLRVGDTTADAVGRFGEVPVRVPDSFGDSAPGTQFTIGATSGPVYAGTPFVLTG